MEGETQGLGRKRSRCSVYGENKHRVSHRSASLGRHQVQIHMKNEEGHSVSFRETKHVDLKEPKAVV